MVFSPSWAVLYIVLPHSTGCGRLSMTIKTVQLHAMLCAATDVANKWCMVWLKEETNTVQIFSRLHSNISIK